MVKITIERGSIWYRPIPINSEWTVVLWNDASPDLIYKDTLEITKPNEWQYAKLTPNDDSKPQRIDWDDETHIPLDLYIKFMDMQKVWKELGLDELVS